MTGRYQVILMKCDGTSSRYWDTVHSAADSIKKLFDVFGWRGDLLAEQKFFVRDTKKGVDMSEFEYQALAVKINGWEWVAIKT